MCVVPQEQHSVNSDEVTLQVTCVYFRRIRKITKRDYQLGHVCLSVRMQQLGSNWTDFMKLYI